VAVINFFLEDCIAKKVNNFQHGYRGQTYKIYLICDPVHVNIITVVQTQKVNVDCYSQGI
jgi:hypothetical protein